MTTREDAKHLTPTKHTPGPWTVDHDGHDTDYVYVMANESTTTVAAMHPAFSSDPRGGRTMADARLIASAPAMLAALEDARYLLRQYHKGEAPGHLDACDMPDNCAHCLACRTIDAVIAQAGGSK